MRQITRQRYRADLMRGAFSRMRSYIGRLKRIFIAKAMADPVTEKDVRISVSLRRFIDEKAASIGGAREMALVPEILIPCFNHGRYLRQALQSIATSGMPVTIINDASTDDTHKHIDNLGNLFTFDLIEYRVSLLQWGSLNRAVSASRNNLFIVLNADDVLLPYSLDLITRTFKARNDIRMLGGSCIPFVDDAILRLSDALPGRLSYDPKLRLYGPDEARNFQRLSDLNMTMSGCSFLRSAWEAAGGFRPFAERVCSYDDRDFQMRVAALFPVAVMDEPLAYYRTSSSLGRALI